MTAERSEATLRFVVGWFERLGSDARLSAVLTPSEARALGQVGRAAKNTLSDPRGPLAAEKQFKDAVAAARKTTALSKAATQLADALISAVLNREVVGDCLKAVTDLLSRSASTALVDFNQGLKKALLKDEEAGKVKRKANQKTLGVETKKNIQENRDTETTLGLDTLRVPSQPVEFCIETLRLQMRQAIAQAGLTQQVVGERMGFSKKRAALNVQKLLKSADPSVRLVHGLAFACGLTISEMLSLPVQQPEVSDA